MCLCTCTDLRTPLDREQPQVLIKGRQSQKNGGKCCTRLDIRCNPGDVVFRIQLLNPDQYAAIEALGFGQLLKLVTDAIESRDLLPWLIDKISPIDMKICIGPGPAGGDPEGTAGQLSCVLHDSFQLVLYLDNLHHTLSRMIGFPHPV